MGGTVFVQSKGRQLLLHEHLLSARPVLRRWDTEESEQAPDLKEIGLVGRWTYLSIISKKILKVPSAMRLALVA